MLTGVRLMRPNVVSVCRLLLPHVLNVHPDLITKEFSKLLTDTVLFAEFLRKLPWAVTVSNGNHLGLARPDFNRD